MSERMTGAQATVAQLAAEGVRVVFGIPGVHTLPICDALLDAPQLRFIHGRHEQGIAFMANGYARASGEIAVSLVITGPGVTNSLTPLADAYQDSVPMVLIAAAVDRARAGKGAFHGLKDQSAVLAGVCKWSARVDAVADIPAVIREAFRQATTGRPGPTAVEIPVDLQTDSCPAEVCPPEPAARSGADPELVREAVRQLSAARAPVLFVGRGAVLSGASDEIVRLAERLGAPCYTTPLAKGVMPEDHSLCLSWGGVRGGLVREFLQEADLVLVVGSSLDEADGSRYGFSFEGKLIQVDAEPAMIGRIYPVEVGLVGDARAVLAQLAAELGAGSVSRSDVSTRIAAKRAETLAGVQSQAMWQYMDAIERALPRDAFVANDGSRVNSWATAYLRRFLLNTYAVTRNTAALGFAWPAAVGARVAAPHGREALAIMGDGGFLFTSFSLATAVQHRIGAVAVVFNDESYGTIAYIQNRQYGRAMGAALRNPDFVRLAECFGAHGHRAETPEQLYETLRAAWGRDLPTVIEVPLDPSIGFA
jgi:thiamine pyrophosphate-dependent acetolactate synthase large subunit-like protein